MLLRGFEINGRGAAPPRHVPYDWRRERRRHRGYARCTTLGHVSLKHPSPDEFQEMLSERLDNLSEAERTELPEHVQDGLRMFRAAAAVLAPGRTVATQIRTVTKALYQSTARRFWRRTKACCYREAGPPTVLDFKYRFEAWRREFVSRHQARAERELEALAERRRLREARRNDRDPSV